MKKLIAKLLICVFVLSGFSVCVFAETEEVTFLKGRGVFENLIYEGEILPQSHMVTRGEFLVCIFNAIGLTDGVAITSGLPFSDYGTVPDAYRSYISDGYIKGILTGIKDGDNLLTGWNQEISRQEAATILGRIFNNTSDTALPYTDSGEVGDWARPYIAALSDSSVLTGYPDNTFKPKNLLNGYNFTQLLKKLIESNLLVDTNLYIYAGSTEFGYKDGEKLEAHFATPWGIALNKNSEIIFADSMGQAIRKIANNMTTHLIGDITKKATDGMPMHGHIDKVNPLYAQLNDPRYVAVAPNGDVYFTEYNNNVVRYLLGIENNVYTFTGKREVGNATGDRKMTQFNYPAGLAFDENGSLYIADSMNHCIKVAKPDGSTTVFAGTSGKVGNKDGSKLAASFNQPTDLHFGSDGALYVVDTGNSVIRKILNSEVTTFAGKYSDIDSDTQTRLGGYKDGKTNEALFANPKGIFVTNKGVVLVADTENNCIRMINNGYVTTIAGNRIAYNSTGPALLSSFNQPIDLVYKAGIVYITDSLNNCIKSVAINLE